MSDAASEALAREAAARSHCGCGHGHGAEPEPERVSGPQHSDPREDASADKQEATAHGGDHGHSHCGGHSHDHDQAHPGQVIQYKEAPPQFGLATHVDDIIHTEFRYVSGFRPFQFHAPGSCLEPLEAPGAGTQSSE
ncbi:hypothetical protein LPJ61_001735 [Coemansia biformis]|uniref:Uncharacterized protein n=1 Tax=Coemansia biformis TaxID=1286918 RepID=A0A9W8CX12_9FUNG|nr:hypothetical protein LPJ61_001735 [Coemansia biformis]